MKKLFLAMMVGVVLTVVGCGMNAKSIDTETTELSETSKTEDSVKTDVYCHNCQHPYMLVTKISCEESQERTFRCGYCNESTTILIPPYGHVFVATEDEDGNLIESCVNCDTCHTYLLVEEEVQ